MNPSVKQVSTLLPKSFSSIAALRVQAHAWAFAGLWRLALETPEADRLWWRRNLEDAIQFQQRVLSRPGLAEVYRRAEREDWVTLPFFLADAVPHVLRIRRNLARKARPVSVEPPDAFDYPD